MLHTHDDFDELVFTVSGSAIHMADGKDYPLIRGDVFVMRGMQEHCFKFRRHLRLMNILYRRPRFVQLVPEFLRLPGFNELFVREPARDAPRQFTTKLRLDARQMEEMLPLIQAMQHEVDRNQTGGELIAESLFKVLVARVCRFYTQAESMPSRAAEMLASRDVRVIDAAMRTGFENSSYFTRKFKAIMGVMPRQYIKLHRSPLKMGE